MVRIHRFESFVEQLVLMIRGPVRSSEVRHNDHVEIKVMVCICIDVSILMKSKQARDWKRLNAAVGNM